MPKKRSPKPQRPGTKAAQKGVQVQSKVQGGRRPLFPGVPSTAHAAGILNHRSVGLFPQSTSSGKRSATRSPPSPGWGAASESTRARVPLKPGSAGPRLDEAPVRTCSVAVGAGSPGPGARRSSRLSHGKCRQKARAGVRSGRQAPPHASPRPGWGRAQGGRGERRRGGASPGAGPAVRPALPEVEERARGPAGRWRRWVGVVQAGRGPRSTRLPARPLEVLEPGRSAQQEPGGGEKWLPLGSAHRQGRV